MSRLVIVRKRRAALGKRVLTVVVKDGCALFAECPHNLGIYNGISGTTIFNNGSSENLQKRIIPGGRDHWSGYLQLLLIHRSTTAIYSVVRR